MAFEQTDDFQIQLEDFYKNCRTTGQWWIASELVTNKKGGKLSFKARDKENTGVDSLVSFLEGNSDKMIFAALRVATKDDAGSVRDKFNFVRYIGSDVGVMKKAKISAIGSNIDALFTSKHITMNINTAEVDSLNVTKIAKELLRVGGAHKPDFYQVGPEDTHVYNANESGVGKSGAGKSFVKKIAAMCSPSTQVAKEPETVAQPEPVAQVEEEKVEEPIDDKPMQAEDPVQEEPAPVEPVAQEEEPKADEKVEDAPVDDAPAKVEDAPPAKVEE